MFSQGSNACIKSDNLCPNKINVANRSINVTSFTVQLSNDLKRGMNVKLERVPSQFLHLLVAR